MVVGPDSGTDAPRAARRCSTLERAGRAVWIRGADDPALRWCYEHARVVLFPTREEGFGLPLLEAMTFHAPVVASDELALREVGGGAPTVTHVDADDADGWRAAIEAQSRPTAPTEPPRLPPGAITWDEHTERLLAIARHVATPDRPSRPHRAARPRTGAAGSVAAMSALVMRMRQYRPRSPVVLGVGVADPRGRAAHGLRRRGPRARDR